MTETSRLRQAEIRSRQRCLAGPRLLAPSREELYSQRPTRAPRSTLGPPPLLYRPPSALFPRLLHSGASASIARRSRFSARPIGVPSSSTVGASMPALYHAGVRARWQIDERLRRPYP